MKMSSALSIRHKCTSDIRNNDMFNRQFFGACGVVRSVTTVINESKFRLIKEYFHPKKNMLQEH